MKKKPIKLPVFINLSLKLSYKERRIEIVDEIIRRYLPGHHRAKNPVRKPKIKVAA